LDRQRDVFPDETVPQGVVGEVILRGPQQCRGYFEREDDTRDRVGQGWYYTYDAGRIDDDGYLVIEGRTVDVFATAESSSW
jgi:long-chain acyl-CoA synthetase